MHSESEHWDMIIRPHTGIFDLRLKDLWHHRYLIFLFIKRDFVAFYKQTILGPLWYILQPLMTTIVFTIIFGKIAKLPTNGVPNFLFYLAGNVTWNYFSGCLNKTSSTFVTNASIFGKVYFPRLTVPIACVITNLVQLSIQLTLFIGFYIYFILQGADVRFTWTILLFPLIVLQMALLGLGMGILLSSLTTKYRDLVYVMGFGVQLWMYATPIVYPASIVPTKYLDWYMLNPMASIVEIFRYSFLGVGGAKMHHVIMGWIVTLSILFVGVLLFNRIEKTFMDTV